MSKKKPSIKASIEDLMQPDPKYKTPTQIEIDKLKNLDLSKTPFDVVFDKVKLLFTKSWVRAVAIHKFTTVYRGRRCEVDKPFVKVSDIWNPNRISGKYNRFNSMEKNLFYGTLGIDHEYCDKAIRTIIREIGLERSKYITAIKFQLRKPHKFVDVIPLGFHSDFIKEIATEDLILQYREILNMMENYMTKINNEGKKRISLNDFNRVNDFLSKIVTETIPSNSNHQYKITAAIGKLLLDKRRFGGVDNPIGFYYHSVKWCYGTANFACRTQIFDRLYEPIQAYFGIVKKIDEDEHFVLQKQSSKIESGKIIW